MRSNFDRNVITESSRSDSGQFASFFHGMTFIAKFECTNNPFPGSFFLNPRNDLAEFERNITRIIVLKLLF